MICFLLCLVLCYPVHATAPGDFDLVYAFSDGCARVVQELKWGLLDESLEMVLPLSYDYIGTLSKGRRLIMKNLRFGFLDESHQEVIPPVYLQAGNFSEGLSCVKNESGQWGYIDREGKTVLPFAYEDANDFSCTYALVRENGAWQFVDSSGLPLVTPPLEEAYPFSENLACVRQGELYGYLDTAGAIAIAPRFDLAFDFCEGAAVVSVDGAYGLIDSAGEYLIPPVWEGLSSQLKGGYLQGKKNGKWGIIDHYGNAKTPFIYDHIGVFSQGMCPVATQEGWGYLNENFRTVIPPVWDHAGDFSEGLAPVMKDDVWQYINSSGEVVSDNYHACGRISAGYATVCDEALRWHFAPLSELEKKPEVTIPAETLPAQTLHLVINRPYIQTDSGKISLEAAPVLIDGVTMMPIRAVVEAIGGEVGWEAESGTITMSRNGHLAQLTVGETGAFADGRLLPLTMAPRIENQRTLVPLRFVMEAFECEVKWVEETQEIYLYY